MSWDNIVDGDYGQTVQLTVLDTDTDTAADASAYTESQEMIFKDPLGAETTKTAAFEGDGSDGVVEYALANGDIDKAGLWQARAVVKSGSAKLSSTWLQFKVLP